MENVLLLNSNKPATFSFNVEISGVDTSKPITVRLCMFVEKTLYCFLANRESEVSSTFIVDVPALPHIPKTSYPFKIEVIADGYFFEAMHGGVNIVGDPLASVTPVPPVVKIEAEKKPLPQVQETTILRNSEKSIKQLAEEAVKKVKDRIEEKKNDKVVDNTETYIASKYTKLKVSEDNIPNEAQKELLDVAPSKEEVAKVIVEQPKVENEVDKEIKEFLKTLKEETTIVSKQELPKKTIPKPFKKGKIIER